MRMGLVKNVLEVPDEALDVELALCMLDSALVSGDTTATAVHLTGRLLTHPAHLRFTCQVLTRVKTRLETGERCHRFVKMPKTRGERHRRWGVTAAFVLREPALRKACGLLETALHPGKCDDSVDEASETWNKEDGDTADFDTDEHGLCGINDEHGLCGINYEHGLCGITDQHGLCGITDQHGLCGITDQHGICGINDEHGLCGINDEHCLCGINDDGISFSVSEVGTSPFFDVGIQDQFDVGIHDCDNKEGSWEVWKNTTSCDSIDSICSSILVSPTRDYRSLSSLESDVSEILLCSSESHASETFSEMSDKDVRDDVSTTDEEERDDDENGKYDSVNVGEHLHGIDDHYNVLLGVIRWTTFKDLCKVLQLCDESANYTSAAHSGEGWIQETESDEYLLNESELCTPHDKESDDYVQSQKCAFRPQNAEWTEESGRPDMEVDTLNQSLNPLLGMEVDNNHGLDPRPGMEVDTLNQGLHLRPGMEVDTLNQDLHPRPGMEVDTLNQGLDPLPAKDPDIIKQAYLLTVMTPSDDQGMDSDNDSKTSNRVTCNKESNLSYPTTTNTTSKSETTKSFIIEKENGEGRMNFTSGDNACEFSPEKCKHNDDDDDDDNKYNESAETILAPNSNYWQTRVSLSSWDIFNNVSPQSTVVTPFTSFSSPVQEGFASCNKIAVRRNSTIHYHAIHSPQRNSTIRHHAIQSPQSPPLVKSTQESRYESDDTNSSDVPSSTEMEDSVPTEESSTSFGTEFSDWSDSKESVLCDSSAYWTFSDAFTCSPEQQVVVEESVEASKWLQEHSAVSWTYSPGKKYNRNVNMVKFIRSSQSEWKTPPSQKTKHPGRS